MVTGQVSKMIGAGVKRKEDPRLITGEGKYTDDVHLRRGRGAFSRRRE